MAVGIKVRSVPFNKKKKKANEARNSKYLKKSVKKIKIIRKNKNMLHYEWSQGKENKPQRTHWPISNQSLLHIQWHGIKI